MLYALISVAQKPQPLVHSSTTTILNTAYSQTEVRPIIHIETLQTRSLCFIRDHLYIYLSAARLSKYMFLTWVMVKQCRQISLLTALICQMDHFTALCCFIESNGRKKSLYYISYEEKNRCIECVWQNIQRSNFQCGIKCTEMLSEKICIFSLFLLNSKG